MLARVARRLRRRGDSSRGRLVGMMAVRNESWVLGLTLRAALEYCDAVVVTDHRSTDDSVRILEEMRAQSRAGAIHLERSQQAEWMEMDERQAMLDRARAIGGTHFVIVDADELPTANLLPKLKRWALDTPPGQFLSLPMVSPWHALDVRRTDGVWGDLSRVPINCIGACLNRCAMADYWWRRARAACSTCSSPMLSAWSPRPSGTR
jgi:hypothetical protein